MFIRRLGHGVMSGAMGRSSARPVRRVDVHLFHGGPRRCQARHAATAKGGGANLAVVIWGLVRRRPGEIGAVAGGHLLYSS